MLNAVSNPVNAAQTVAPASSPLSMLFNAGPDASGQPAFAQVVHDTLNRAPGNVDSPQPNKSTQVDSALAPQTSPPSLPTKFSSPKLAPDSKQTNQPRPQHSASDSEFPPALLPPAVFALQPVPIQEVQSQSISSTAVDSQDASVTPDVTSSADPQPPQASAPKNVATQFASQLLASLSSPALDVPESLATKPTAHASKQIPSSATGNPTPSNATIQADTAATATSVSLGAAAQAAAIARAQYAANSQASSLAVSANSSLASALAQADLATSPTATPVSDGETLSVETKTSPASSASAQSVAPQNPNIFSQTHASSANAQDGERLSTIFDQIAALQGSASTHPASPAVTVDITQITAPSQLAASTTGTILNSSSLPHVQAAATALASSDTKAAQPNSTESHSVNAAQTSAAATSDRSSSQGSSSQDSSSNPQDQSSSNSLDSSSSSVSSIPSTKNQAPDFSDLLSGLSAPKPDAASVAQVPAVPTPAAASPVVMPLQSADPNPHPAPQALPSAPAQTQPALPSPHAPDAPWGHVVSDAQLTNSTNETEMRIAMQTDKLGAVELHARVSGDEIGASILVEKHDAHAALAVELPALQQSLSDKQLRVGQVALTQGSLSSTAGDAGANAQQNQRGTPQSSPASPTASFWTEARSLSTAAWFVSEQVGAFNAQGRLSVQA
ncbi:MAG: flagellar hook-length control protein FliK [Candidatus Acidiferrum sp.]